MTPTHGTPLTGDQAAYDADQDARIRRARRYANAALGLALACAVACPIVVAIPRRSEHPRPAPPPIVHVAAPACPPAPTCPPCVVACAACPQPPGRHR